MVGGSGAELAKSDPLAIIRPTATSINKGRVETVHIEVLIVDKEALAHGSVSVIKSVYIEPTKKKNEREKQNTPAISLGTFMITYSSSSGRILQLREARIYLF